MTNTNLLTLKKERSKLFDAWRIAGVGQKNSILMRISDIDEELEEYKSKKKVVLKYDSCRCTGFTKSCYCR